MDKGPYNYNYNIQKNQECWIQEDLESLDKGALKTPIKIMNIRREMAATAKLRVKRSKASKSRNFVAFSKDDGNRN